MDIQHIFLPRILKLLLFVEFYIEYYMSKKKLPILYSKLLYQMGKYFMDKQHNFIKPILFTVLLNSILITYLLIYQVSGASPKGRIWPQIRYLEVTKILFSCIRLNCLINALCTIFVRMNKLTEPVKHLLIFLLRYVNN